MSPYSLLFQGHKVKCPLFKKMQEDFYLRDCCKYYDGAKCRYDAEKNFKGLYKAVEKKDRRLDISREKSNYLY